MISSLLTIAVAGFLVWLITTYIPMPPAFRAVCVAVAVVIILYYALQVLGPPGVSAPLLR